MNILQEFRIISGLSMNKTKTKAMWLIFDRKCHDTPGTIVFNLILCSNVRYQKLKIEKYAPEEESNNPNQIDINLSTLYKIIYAPPIAQNFWQRKFSGDIFDWKIISSSSWTFQRTTPFITTV